MSLTDAMVRTGDAAVWLALQCRGLAVALRVHVCHAALPVQPGALPQLPR
jgi:hypothetical protein